MLKLITIIFTIFVMHIQSECQTPDNQVGKCVPTATCHGLDKILGKIIITDDDFEFLRKSECFGQNGMVCCATSTNSNTADKTSTPQMLPVVGECGISAFTDRIYGGNRTKIDEFPWTALIQYEHVRTKDLSFNCAGSLINEHYVLTAAHCVPETGSFSRNYKPVSIRLAEWDQSTEKDCDSDGDCINVPVQNIKISSTFPHRKFNHATQLNDIALIRLEKPAEYNSFVGAICLPYTNSLRSQNLLDNKSMWVTGWGTTESKQGSDIKLKVDIKAVPLSKCQQVFSNVMLQDTQICAGSEKGKDACQGDSGGPLMKNVNDNGQNYWYLVGIVSFGKGCGLEGTPALYTKVSEYMDWIMDQISQT